MKSGKKLAKLRRGKGLTQKQLAEAASLSVSAICHYERNTRRPKLGHAESLAEVLGVNAEALMTQDLDTPEKLIHILFSMEDDEHIKPVAEYGRTVIVASDDALKRAMDDWVVKREAVQFGDMTEEEYHIWKDSYTTAKETSEVGRKGQEQQPHDARSPWPSWPPSGGKVKSSDHTTSE